MTAAQYVSMIPMSFSYVFNWVEVHSLFIRLFGGSYLNPADAFNNVARTLSAAAIGLI